MGSHGREHKGNNRTNREINIEKQETEMGEATLKLLICQCLSKLSEER